MSEKEPTVFGGRYELHRRLARGGMADVFVARDQLLGRPVAVKVLFPEFATDPKFVERFRREAQSAANLNHPNIVNIYDWGEELGTYYIVMEYVEGQSLAQILRRDGRLSPEQVTRVALDVSAALGFAHDGDVVHRDVKPGNVLVSPKGEMKVADFGIATALTSTTESNLTQTGAVMGTATYFSPEQAQGKKVDHRSDLYSLGVVMYEMLVGRPPFTGETPVSIAYKHVQEPVPPVSEQGVEIPPALAAICMKLLSKNPDNRYPSAAALRADLDRFRQGQMIAAAQAAAPPAAAMQRTTAMPAQPGGTRVIPQTYVEPPRRRFGLVLVGLLTLGLILAGFLVLAGDRLFGIGDDSVPEPTTEVVQQVEVPGLGDRPEADAAGELRARNLVVETRAVASDSVAAGRVIQTEPAAGSVVPEGSTIVLVVSSGPNAVQVPPVVTLSQNEALSALTDADLRPEIEAVTTNFAPEGEVIAQFPEAGTFLTKGETVRIQVSAGVEEIPVPDVRGRTREEATALLEESGFIVDPTAFTFELDDEIPKDRVVRTSPAANTLMAPNSSVELVLSDGPAALFLPSIIGVDRATARQQLVDLGLDPIEFASPVTNPALANTVVETFPEPNTLVEPGDQVQVYIGILTPSDGGQPGPGNGNGNGNGGGNGNGNGNAGAGTTDPGDTTAGQGDPAGDDGFADN